MIKLVGIVVDNYKVEKFKKELNDGGFTDLEILPFDKKHTLTLIRIKCDHTEFFKAAKILDDCEKYFTALKN